MQEQSLKRGVSSYSGEAGRVRPLEVCEFVRANLGRADSGVDLGIINHTEFDDHERVLDASDLTTGLRAIIAVHSTVLGPAGGGCRMWPYVTRAEALTDVLRLSRGMSYKNAIAGLPMGGGKAVIIGDPATQKTPELLDGFGQAVNALGGRYVTAEDVGISLTDLERVSQSSPYVTGLRAVQGFAGGDPSPKTAYGVYLGIKAAVRRVRTRDSLRGLIIAIQGVGAVGMELARLLHAEGASLVVADKRFSRAVRAREAFGARVVEDNEILFQLVDVLAPCALGGVLNETTIPELDASIICGAANNQLATREDGERLRSRGILYAPDYVVNAGGIITVAAEYLKHWSATETQARIERIPDTLTAIFEQAETERRATSEVADEMARAILQQGRSSEQEIS